MGVLSRFLAGVNLKICIGLLLFPAEGVNSPSLKGAQDFETQTLGLENCTYNSLCEKCNLLSLYKKYKMFNNNK